MGKYENIIKIEKISHLLNEKEYKKAAHIVDSIEINKIKEVTDLNIIADALTQNKRYNEAMDVLNRIYTKSQSRRIVYQLLDVSIKMGDLELAKEYYEEYHQLAPRDPYCFIFQYFIDKMDGKPIKDQIQSLEDLKAYEYMEEWAYELATLYHKAGMKEQCIQECSDIILWFGSGIYTKKARLLKGYYEGEIDLFQLLREQEEKEEKKISELSEVNEEKMSETSEKEEKTSENNERKERVIGYNGEEEKEISEDPEKNVEKVSEIIVSEENLQEDRLEDFFSEYSINYKKIFGNYITINENKEQILDALEEIKNNSINHINFIITGNPDTDITSFTKAMLSILCKLDYIKTNKVGIICGEKLNKIDMNQKIKILNNCSIIIQNASVLDDKTLDEIEKLMQEEMRNLVVVLEDTDANLEQLQFRREELSQFFNFTIHVSDCLEVSQK